MKVSIVFEQQEYLYDAHKLQMFGILREMEGQKLLMPKWVSKESFQLLRDFLSGNVFNTNALYSDQMLQRMLWLSDHLQCDELQEKVIQELISPRIQLKNCTLFLNEAFKKLKACEESSDVWYMLLNNCMNFTAKNLIVIVENQLGDVQKINQKIIEEILERALKYHRRKNIVTTAELLKVILTIRGYQNAIELINSQKQIMRNKKINFQTHPSINWKLSNLSSIINKETQAFKFSEYNWKLVAKMEDNKVLRIYLKLESQAPGEDQEEIPKDKEQRILCLYFLLSLNNSHEKLDQYELKPSYIIAERGQMVQLCEFKDHDLYAYDQQKLEFTVFLNTDQVLSLAINHIFQNLEYVMKTTPDISAFDHEDALILLKASPHTQKTQEQALTYLIFYLSKLQASNDLQLKFIQALQPQFFNQQFLQQVRLSPEIQVLKQVVAFVDRQLDKHFISTQPTQHTQQTQPTLHTQSSSSKQQQSSRIEEKRINRSQERGAVFEMPLNKLEKLKKNTSQPRVNKVNDELRRESTYSQQSSQEKSFFVMHEKSDKEMRRKMILEEINVVKFLRNNDPYLVKELQDVMNSFL